MAVNLSKFRTAHALARELLLGPDLPVILPMPTFDMPGQLTAYPVKAEAQDVQGQPCVLIVVDQMALDPAPDGGSMPPAPESKP